LFCIVWPPGCSTTSSSLLALRQETRPIEHKTGHFASEQHIYIKSQSKRNNSLASGNCSVQVRVWRHCCGIRNDILTRAYIQPREERRSEQSKSTTVFASASALAESQTGVSARPEQADSPPFPPGLNTGRTTCRQLRALSDSLTQQRVYPPATPPSPRPTFLFFPLHQPSPRNSPSRPNRTCLTHRLTVNRAPKSLPARAPTTGSRRPPPLLITQSRTSSRDPRNYAAAAMVGSATYTDAEIAWILDQALAGTKSADIQNGFRRFGRGLSASQLRYVKGKYGRDPRFK